MNAQTILRDPYSGERFIPARLNQIYANKRTQVLHNNAKARQKRIAKAFIDKPLDRNRTVLMNLLKDDNEVSVSREFLRGTGFNDCLYTHFKVIDKTKQVVQFFIYEYGFMKDENDNIKIFKQ